MSILRVCAVLALGLVAQAATAAELIGVRFGPDGDKTRVVFDLLGEPSFSISGDTTGEGRLLIDFAELSISAEDQEYRQGKGHIVRYGFAESRSAGSRAVLVFGKTAKIKEAFLIPPSAANVKYRLVVDLETADEDAFLASLPNRYPDIAAVIEQSETVTADIAAPVSSIPAPAQADPTPPPSPPEAVEKHIIVVDAGHGGGDPGAQGQSGTLEKRVTLSAALELSKILTKTGRYEVVLTRSGDKKIKPDEREALARTAGADLFISLHADAIAERGIRGGSVYTLSEQGSQRSAQIAKSEGNYHLYDLDAAKYGEVVGSILLDKAQDETNTASSQFAETLLDMLSGKTPLLNKSHRTGDLRVLLAPDVPAVLFEMAFISNAKDEANLNSPVWRRRTMEAVADSIDQYFEEFGERRFASSKAAGAK